MLSRPDLALDEIFVPEQAMKSYYSAMWLYIHANAPDFPEIGFPWYRFFFFKLVYGQSRLTFFCGRFCNIYMNTGVDPSMDPELAMALRVSMEEERARQEAASKATAEQEAAPAPAAEAAGRSAVARWVYTRRERGAGGGG